MQLPLGITDKYSGWVGFERPVLIRTRLYHRATTQPTTLRRATVVRHAQEVDSLILRWVARMGSTRVGCM